MSSRHLGNITAKDSMNCIETRYLSYAFAGQVKVLERLSMQVRMGSVYGFLGPNGAGKTTTLRLLLGLLKKQQGIITIFNKSLDTDRIEILRKVGSLIESPSLYGHLTATENLRVWQLLYQCSTTRIAEVLDLVGLSHTAQKRISEFSLGMKQRLSIAVALLHSPSLLILDEPTNGLDPQGIIDIREMLRRLNQEQNITVLISSHLLAEIERLVTHLGIINQGRMLFEGTLSELKARQSAEVVLLLKTSDSEQAARIIRSQGFEPNIVAGHIRIRGVDTQSIARLNAALVKNDIDVYQIQKAESDLESLFIDLVKRN